MLREPLPNGAISGSDLRTLIADRTPAEEAAEEAAAAQASGPTWGTMRSAIRRRTGTGYSAAGLRRRP